MFDGEDCYGALSLYRSIESAKKNTNKLVIGPWAHGQWGGTNETSLGNILFESNTSMRFSERSCKTGSL
jgi:predicted acyl esterase